MQPNPLMKALGLSDNDRAVIIHTDDIGMCHASLAAYADLVDAGIISAASTMTPCPWFPATAQFCKENPDTRQKHLKNKGISTLCSLCKILYYLTSPCFIANLVISDRFLRFNFSVARLL